MGNMSYCRFVNTYGDLLDCNDHLNDSDLSEDEEKYRKALIVLCVRIAEDYGQDFEEEVSDGQS